MKILKQILGMFRRKYSPEPGETVIKTFSGVFVDKKSLRERVAHDIVITDKKLVLSSNSLGGYPGFNFYFDTSAKIEGGMLGSDSAINEIRMDGEDLLIFSRGAFIKIRIVDKVRAIEIFSLLKGKVAHPAE